MAIRTNNESAAPLPVDQLFSKAMRVYRSAFGPLFAAAAIGTLLANAIIVAAPPDSLPIFSALVLVSFSLGALSQAAVLVMAIEKRAGSRPNISTAYGVALGLSPRYIGAFLPFVGAPMVIIYAGTAIFGFNGAWLFSPGALFVLARWALYGPAVVLGGAGPLSALRVSGRLVTGRTARTMGIIMLLIGAGLLAQLIALAIIAGIGGGPGPEIVVSALAAALFQPLGIIIALLLYEDYQRLTPRQAGEGGAPGYPPSFDAIEGLPTPTDDPSDTREQRD